MIVIQDCTPMMADVISGAIPRPELLQDGVDVVAWARATPAIRALCAMWDVTPAALSLAPGAVVHLAGRLVALNVDGTRCAFYTAGDLAGEGVEA